ncbi:MAG: hypothetical protein KJ725_12240 [Gammaproteobacteria bacterium]|jgi:hypothetical protein|uniref:hypothetical protein n=1 Tax=unclassified Methylotuvimicrobium TaxID=2822412 RepID=UPI001D9C5118|nr:hypothetical protein [Gammaproteobacteria bacterium]
MEKPNTILPGAWALMTVILAFVLSGCAKPFWGGYGDTGLSRDAFEVYVEQVFRFQNRLTNEVMLLSLRSEDLNQFNDIYLAEHKMHEICSPLNEYVAKSMDDQNAGLLLMRRLERSVAPCEQAAQYVDLLLRHLD